jgi:hypothetical protein
MAELAPQIAGQAEAVQDATNQRRTAVNQLATLVREGHAAGIRPSELAVLAGVSRVTIYEWLKAD